MNTVTQLENSLEQLNSAWIYQSELVAKIQSTSDISSKNRYRKKLEIAYQKDTPMVFECVDKHCVADVVSGWTGVPIGACLDSEQQKVSGLLRCLEQLVLGQPYAMSVIASQVLICRTIKIRKNLMAYFYSEALLVPAKLCRLLKHWPSLFMEMKIN